MAKQQAAKLDLNGLNLAAIAAKLNKKYGENTVISASQAEGLTINHVSTGVYALDFALGGGFAENRIHEVRGGFSSLKSTVISSAIKNFLAKYPEGIAAIIDAEHSFDPKYLRMLGFTAEQLKNQVLVTNPDSGEQAIDVLNDVLLITDRAVFVFLDSIAALVPMSEIEGSVEQQTMGVHARLVNKFVRISNARIKRSLYDAKRPSATIVCANQLRQKITMFGNPETTPGGVGKDFYFSSILRFASSSSDAITKDVTQNGVTRTLRFGQNVKFSVLKNKVGGSQFEEGTFVYYIREMDGYSPYSFNNLDVLFKHAVFHDVITLTPGGSFAYADIMYKRESLFIDKLRAKPQLVKDIYEATLEASLRAEFPQDANAEAKFDAADKKAAEEETYDIVEVPPKLVIAAKVFKKVRFK